MNLFYYQGEWGLEFARRREGANILFAITLLNGVAVDAVSSLNTVDFRNNFDVLE